MSPFKKPVSVRKATNYAIVINGMQILLILVMLFTNNPKLKQVFNQFRTHNMRGKEAE